jgi:hypothetical protein
MAGSGKSDGWERALALSRFPSGARQPFVGPPAAGRHWVNKMVALRLAVATV